MLGIALFIQLILLHKYDFWAGKIQHRNKNYETNQIYTSTFLSYY